MSLRRLPASEAPVVLGALHGWRLVALLCFLASVLGLSAAAQSAPGDALETIRIQLKWSHQFQFAGYYAAIEKGFYAEEGLNVELLERGPVFDYAQTVLNGDAEYGTGDAALLNLAKAGKPVVVLAQIFQRSPLVFLALKESGIQNPFDMAGKRVSIETLAQTNGPLDSMLKNTLGGNAKVEILKQSIALQDLLDGKVDVISAYLSDQPFQLLRMGVGFNIIDPSNYGVDMYGDNLFTTQAEIEQHPDRVERVLRATLKGWHYALEHPEEIIALLRNHWAPGADPEWLAFEARTTASLIMPDIVPVGSVDRGRYRNFARHQVELGVFADDTIPQAFVYQRPVQGGMLETLTPEEQDFLREHPRITVSTYHEAAPYGFVDESGNYVGVVPDLTGRLETLLGIQLTFNPVEYGELVDRVAAGTADLSTLNDPLDADYAARYLRTQDCFFLPFALFLSRGLSSGSGAPGGLQGKTIALCEGWDVKHPALKVLEGCRFVFGASMLECINMVIRGEADGMFDVQSEIRYLLEKHSIEDLVLHRAYNEGYPAAFFVRNDWPELHSALDKALQSISKNERIQLLKKWNAYLNDPLYRLVSMELNTEERAWLKEHPELSVGFHPGWAPISSSTADHKFEGIAVDYLNYLGGLLGNEFRPVDEPWHSLMERARSGQLDVIPALTETRANAADFIFTQAWRTVSMVVLSRKNEAFISNLGELSGKKVAHISGYGLADRLRSDQPTVIWVPAGTAVDALDMVRRGEVDACLTGMLTAGQAMSQFDYADIKVAGTTPYEVSIQMAVPKDRAILAGILQKALDIMPLEEREAIDRRWVSVRLEEPFDYSLLWKSGGAILLLILFILFWNRYLAHEVARRTAAMELALQASRESDRRFKAIFNQTFQFIGLLSPSGAILAANETALRFVRLEESDVIGKPFWDTPWWSHDTALQARLRDDIARVAQGAFVRFETVHIDWTGEPHIVDFSLKPITGETGAIDFLLPEGRDITEVRRAQKAFKESEERYRILFESAGDAILILKDETFVDCNNRAPEMFGCAREELLGQPPYNFSPATQPDGRESREKAVEKMLAALHGTPQLFEWMHMRLDGTPFEAEVSLNAVTLHEGTFIQAFVRDISERKRAEEKHVELESQLRQAQKMEAIGTLAGGIAHDFNNLLQVIQGGLEIAFDDIPQANPARDCLEESAKAADRAAGLVRQLLTFSRRGTAETRQLDLNDVVAGLMKMLRRVIGEHVELFIKQNEGLYPVMADPGEMEQILMNLCVNARDAMPNGGKILIETTNVTVDTAYCQSCPDAKEGSYVLICVSDTGTGIPKDILDRIFEPFFTTKDVGQGTGLGLATVYAIAKRNGGFLNVYSEVDQGSAFHVYLPADESSEGAILAGGIPAALQPDVRGGTETILYAEDDPQVRQLGVRILSRAGYRVIEAADGQQALDRFAEHNGELDIALLDVMMPKHSGRAVHDAIRSKNSDIPVLFASGYSFDVLGPQFLPDPDARLVKKPFTRTTLLETVREMLDADRKTRRGGRGGGSLT
ncbi:MAG: ABC transporter substrate-binding protein [Candidatus Hydrogenedentes bacterium]|nr:ABC transporter substrate-binding protein [Candidatus Hydrogenedentota bacterium]